MKKAFKSILCLLFLTVAPYILLSQEKIEMINSGALLKEGIELYVDENYEQALKKYEKIPENDTNYYIAVCERLLTHYQLEQYDEAVLLAEDYLSPGRERGPTFYLNFGSNLDMLERYHEAIKHYDQALEKYPMNHLLIYNKGFSYMKAEEYAKAIELYTKVIEMNPFHAKSHLQMGVLAMNEGKTAMAMLAFNAFLLVAPASESSLTVLQLLNEVATSKYQEETEPKGVDIELGDDFSDIDLLLHNYVGLDKKYKVKSKLPIPLVKQTHVLLTQLSEKPKSNGFWYRNYVPFYKKLMKEKEFKNYSLYLLLSSENEKHQSVISRKKSKLKDFIDWIISEWDDAHRIVKLDFNGKEQEVSVFRSNKGFKISSVGKRNEVKKIFNDYTEYYHPDGNIASCGEFNRAGERMGEWKTYHENGNIKEKGIYTEDKQVGTWEYYNEQGILSTTYTIKEELLNGPLIFHDDAGAKSRMFTIVDGVRDGTYEEYYAIGGVYYSTTIEGDNPAGDAVYYYDSGEKFQEFAFVDGKRSGEKTIYFRNGDILVKTNYLEGELDGEYIEYYSNGQIAEKGKYVKGSPVGNYKIYYRDGNIKRDITYDESGKKNGISKEYDTDGKLMTELEYKRGEIIAYRHYDKQGNVVKEDKRKWGDFYYEGIFFNGNISAKGTYGKDDHQGEWKYYNVNGFLEKEVPYEDGKENGAFKEYFANGEIETITPYKDGEKDGYYQDRFIKGNLFCQGYYKEDGHEGVWKTYYKDSTLKYKNYYLEGKKHGIQKQYAVNGKLSFIFEYINGIYTRLVSFDSSGNVINDIKLPNGTGKMQKHYSRDGQVEFEYTLLHGKYHGDYRGYYPNGELECKGQYWNDERHGTWEWYYPNGQLNTRTHYAYGSDTGKWEYYHENGNLYKIARYEDDMLHGAYAYYYENGKKSMERTYKYGDLYGKTMYYSWDGTLDHIRYYDHNQIVAYSYLDKNGEEVKTEIKNETAAIKTYFKNGNTSREFTLNKGWFEGPYIKYHPNGNVFEKYTYRNNYIQGEKLEYYPDGTLKAKYNYVDDELEGLAELYYSNGHIKRKSTYLNNELHGKTYNYNKTGKLTSIYHYYDDVLIYTEEK